MVLSEVQELPENRVRVEVEVPVEDVQHAVDHAASDLAGSLKIPGFRKGKVPMQVLIARVGKERLYSEAVETHIGGWLQNALVGSKIRPVEQPEYGYDLPDDADNEFRFTATVGVQPKPEVADWTTLEVPRAEAEVPSELIDAELEVLRDSVATLTPAGDRPVQDGDTVVVDLLRGEETHRDYVAEVGAGRLLPEIEQGLVGMAKGETKEIEFTGPDGPHTVEASVKDVKEKELPPLDDELARSVSEFDTLAELRSDIEGRLREQLEAEIEADFRQATVEALVRASDVRPSPQLVGGRAQTLLNELVRALGERGLSVENYLALTNQTPEELQERFVAQAAGSLAGELVLEAVADKLELEVSDEEIEEALRAQDEPDETIEQVLGSALADRIREDLRLRKALDRVTADVKPIEPEVAAAREKLWTPEQEKAPTDTKLWTPGSKETV
jgi:trigger factor